MSQAPRRLRSEICLPNPERRQVIEKLERRCGSQKRDVGGRGGNQSFKGQSGEAEDDFGDKTMAVLFGVGIVIVAVSLCECISQFMGR